LIRCTACSDPEDVRFGSGSLAIGSGFWSDSVVVELPRYFFAFFPSLAAFTGEFNAGAPFLRAAQRAFMDAANLARPSAVNPLFFLGALAAFGAGLDSTAAGSLTVALDVPLLLAHRFVAAAEIFARASGDIVRFPVLFPDGAFALESSVLSPPSSPLNLDCSAAICLRMFRASSSFSIG